MIVLLALIVAAFIHHKWKQNRRTSIHIDWEFNLEPVRVDDYRLKLTQCPIPALESEEVTGDVKLYTREDARDALSDRGR